ncbi:MAG: hypothetical protein NTW87_16080 [Planctomycetota bacterium]|nr:hypothetical protein [Planctomycetota bacterium]
MSAWSVALPVILGGIATLAIYSFLVKENPFYRFFEHLYIGIATGFGIVFGVQRFLWPELLGPMLGYDREVCADGSFDRPWRSWYLLYLLPFAFGTLYYFIYSKKRQWLSRVVIAWSLGVSGGFAVKGFFAQYMPQIIGSFKPLVAVQTVERNLLLSFRDVADHLPPNAQVAKGRIDLFRLGPSYVRLVIKDKDGALSELSGQVTDVNDDPKEGSLTLLVNNEERKVPSADIVLREDQPPPRDVADACEGHGGEHDYFAYRLLRSWDPKRANWTYRRHIPDTGPGSREALATALRAADPAARVKAVEETLDTRLGPVEVGLVNGLDPKDEQQVAAALSALLRWQPEDYAPAAENNAGIPLLVSEKAVVRDVYRAEKWTTNKREPVGVKTCELSPETLRSWFDRPETDLGVVLQRKGGAGGSFLHRFASSANPDAARRPKLVIGYFLPGEKESKELVLQNGQNGYSGAAEAVTVSGLDVPAPMGPEFLLGASARKVTGGLSLDFWSFKGMVANWIFAITLICVMTYFLFSFEHNRPGIYQASMAGRWLMMLCFGAFFGSTIMARMALLVERLQFLIEKWLPTLFGQG